VNQDSPPGEVVSALVVIPGGSSRKPWMQGGEGDVEIEVEGLGAARANGLMRVRDDGSGNSPQDEDALAVGPHAISKIAELEDWEQGADSGVSRAKPCPASCPGARLAITSRHPATAIHAGKREGDGHGHYAAPIPAAMPTGTQVEVA